MWKTATGFPKGFLWGGTITANRAEGVWNIDGKRPSMANIGILPKRYDRKHVVGFTHTAQQIKEALQDKDGYYPRGHGIDFYHTYKEDLALMKEMGFSCSRTSFNWTHTFPDGNKDLPGEEGLKYCDVLLDEMLENGIEPVMTVSHYEMPAHLVTKYKGWYASEIIDSFIRFCEVLFKRYHKKVKYWIPLNQINSLGGWREFASLGMVEGGYENWENTKYQTMHYQFVACARAMKLTYETDAGMRIGMMLGDDTLYPVTCRPEDVFANTQRMQMGIYFYSGVLLRGEYPGYTLRYSKDHQIQIHVREGELKLLKGRPVNFLSFSYYFARIVDVSQPQPKEDPYLGTSIWNQAIDLLGFRNSLSRYWDRYHVPIFITESELDATNTIIDGHIHDEYHITYLREHIKAMREAILDGVQVLGYASQGPVGIVSCLQGEVSKRYGYIYVDRDDHGNGSNARVRKDSFTWYQYATQTNGEEL